MNRIWPIIRNRRKAWSVLVLCMLFSHPVCAKDTDQLFANFLNPPPGARPWVYWFIMDGNLSREGITADLEAMQRAGIGGFIMMEVDVGVPRGPVKFMSREWQDLFRHAVKEAERLGLQITLNAGPGWTGSGGPWVKPEQSMQHLVASETNITGPTQFEGVLPKPQPRKPFFGEGALPPELETARKEYYRDEFVLAVPTSPQPYHIADIDEQALYLRAPYSSQPGVRPFLPEPTAYPLLLNTECIAAKEVVDLTQAMTSDGRLRWDAPAGNWTLLRFGRASTGQNTRPAPVPGLGLESDKFSASALDSHFAAFIEPLQRGLNQRQNRKAGWTMLHIDSWEMSSQNWTAGFREAFSRRRGYDPLPFLPVMTGRVVESLEISERFLWDLRLTAQELVVQNHAEHLKSLAHRHGLGLSIEPYDMNPCADLTLGGAADVPMCEFWAKGYGFDTDFSCFEAVSIAHTLGKPIVGAESFTSLDAERWQLYPGAMKTQGDWALCTGINRLVFHRYQHQPQLDRWPGMTMGSIGSHWERTQTWWELVPAYHRYLARCQFLLRQGLPVADICYLVPEGAPQVFRPPKSATRGNPPDHLGYAFDACAPEVLRRSLKVDQGQLVLPSGTRYRVLVMPEFDTMTPALLAKIKDLIRSGATVIGRPPAKSPSLSGYPRCDQEVKRLADEIWGPRVSHADAETSGSGLGSTRERMVGKGRVVWRDEVTRDQTNSFRQIYPDYPATADLLRAMGVVADFESEAPLRYTHRQLGEAHIYFVSNPANVPLLTQARFRVSGLQPEWWNAVTGERRLLPEYTDDGHGTAVTLRFAAGESCFLVFRAPPQKTKAGLRNFAEDRALLEIRGPWELHFQEHRGAPERINLEQLVDWSKHPDPAVRHFSGIATYRTQFGWNAISNHASERIVLDLGEVQVMAAVAVNGKECGVAWTAPWRMEVGGAIRPGRNELEIRVANLWPNRLIADAGLPENQRISKTTWNPFSPDSALLPSGLLGPVRLVEEQR